MGDGASGVGNNERGKVMNELNEAIEEYKQSIDHYIRFRRIMNDMGVFVCSTFWRNMENGNYEIHVHEGIDKIAEIAGAEVNVGDFNTEYKHKLSFDYEDLHFFELVE